MNLHTRTGEEQHNPLPLFFLHTPSHPGSRLWHTDVITERTRKGGLSVDVEASGTLTDLVSEWRKDEREKNERDCLV